MTIIFYVSSLIALFPYYYLKTLVPIVPRAPIKQSTLYNITTKAYLVGWFSYRVAY